MTAQYYATVDLSCTPEMNNSGSHMRAIQTEIYVDNGLQKCRTPVWMSACFSLQLAQFYPLVPVKLHC